MITGFGRCGARFDIQTEDMAPDVITFAKDVTSVHAPVAGVIADSTLTRGHHENGLDLCQIFGDHPVAGAAATAAIYEHDAGLIRHVWDSRVCFARRCPTSMAVRRRRRRSGP